MGIAAFLILVQSLITFVHWVVWQVLDASWPLSGLPRSVFLVFFMSLSFTFLVSNILTRFFPVAGARTFYFYAALWLGTMHFLFLAAVLSALLSLASGLSGLTLPSWVTAVIFLAALAMNGWAMVQGFRVTPVHFEAALPNLPGRWIGKKAVFFADTHFGNIHREKTAAQVAALIEAEAPDLIFMGGDFFDGPPLDAPLVTEPFRSIVARTPSFFVSGNHEEYGDTVGFLRALERIGFRIINDRREVIDGLQIVGLDFVTTRTPEATEMVMMHLMVEDALPTIVLKHVPRNIAEVERGGGDLMLSGHTHRGQMWPFSLVTQLVYAGYDYGLKPHGTLEMYTTSGAGSWGPPQRFGTAAEIAIITLRRR
jgi:uncharacterized protein